MYSRSRTGKDETFAFERAKKVAPGWWRGEISNVGAQPEISGVGRAGSSTSENSSYAASKPGGSEALAPGSVRVPALPEEEADEVESSTPTRISALSFLPAVCPSGLSVKWSTKARWGRLSVAKLAETFL